MSWWRNSAAGRSPLASSALIASLVVVLTLLLALLVYTALQQEYPWFIVF